jgi:hypothetical protein
MSITTFEGSPQADFGPSIAQAAPLAGAAAVEEVEFLGIRESAESLRVESSRVPASSPAVEAERIPPENEDFMLN